ncbi:MAG: NAD(+)/NADH kinase [Bdellovibrionales bacterium]|nr:NAD(+)/NADH kinase [Bdellovibrionales bacterium]
MVRKQFRKKVKNVLVIYRKDTPKAVSLSIDIMNWLEGQGVKTYTSPHQKLKIGKSLAPTAKNLKAIDLALVLGGDGTYLEAVRLLKGQMTPILGINLGSLGFLTVHREEDWLKYLKAALCGKLESRPRSMLKISLKSGSKTLSQWSALNDVVIERGPDSHLIGISIYVGKQLINPVKSDGLIISTPTGSTAYNLAAGGPILHPESRSFVVTPICPHSLTSRPTILPDDQTLRFQLTEKSKRAFLTIDGQKYGEITPRNVVVIERADTDHFVLRDPHHNYFELLREKLKFGER